jgi:MFS family permease
MDRLGAIWLLPASMLTAMAVSFVALSFQAFVVEELTEETRGRVYGITSAMFMVVSIIGPLLGGLIAQGLSFKTMYLVAGCMYAIAGLDSSTSCQAVFRSAG